MPLDEQTIANALAKSDVEISTDNEGDIGLSSLNNDIVSSNLIDLTEKTEEVVDTTEGDTTEVVDNVDPNVEVPTEVPTETVEETVENTIPEAKTLDDYISEKFEGKYKTFDEYEASIKPKEVESLQYANDTVKRIQELALAGFNITPELLSLQGKDFRGMTDPEALVKENGLLTGDYKGWSDREIQLELDDKYKRKEWFDEDGEKTDIGILYERRLQRDSENAKANLIKIQEERTLIKEVDPQIAIDAQTAISEQKVQWNSMVEDFSKTSTDIKTITDSKTNTSFDYSPSTEELSTASKIMNDLNTDATAFFNHFFKKEDGSLDLKGVHTMILEHLSADKRIKIAVDNANAAGAEKEVRDLGNINFKKDTKAPVREVNSFAQAVAAAKGYKLKTNK